MVVKYLYKIYNFIDFTSNIYLNYTKCNWFYHDLFYDNWSMILFLNSQAKYI